MVKPERNAGDRKLIARRTFDERLWPINVALGGLTVVAILFLLRWDDTRPLYNAWTWLTALPIVIGLLVWGLSHDDEHAINQAAQLAALLSVIIHLSLFVTLAARSRQP